MKVSNLFPETVKQAGMLPSDFVMVHAGFFHSYIKHAKGHEVPDFEPGKHAFGVTKFSAASHKYPQNVKEGEECYHVVMHTDVPGKSETHHSSQVEVFLREPPIGSTLIEYWTKPEDRKHTDVHTGRITLRDLRGVLLGWAFEYFTPTSFGMCFQLEADAVMFAAMWPNTVEELKEREKDRHRLKLPSIAHRKLAW